MQDNHTWGAHLAKLPGMIKYWSPRTSSPKPAARTAAANSLLGTKWPCVFHPVVLESFQAKVRWPNSYWA